MASELKVEVGKFYLMRDGRKVGPMHRWREYYSAKLDGDERLWGEDGIHGTAVIRRPRYDLIAEWTDTPTGPVRTVTRKEIVPGVYGAVRIHEVFESGGENGVQLQIAIQHMCAAELRAAIATLTEIADALEADQ